MKKKYFKCIHFGVYMTLFMFLGACKKIVDVEAPQTFVTSGSAFSANQTAIAELNGIYADISAGIAAQGVLLQSLQSISTVAGLSADEFRFGSIGDRNNEMFFQNTLTANLSDVASIWKPTYQYIFYCNTILEGLGKARANDEDPLSKLSPAVKKQLLGEAKFLRAFFYFHLVNLYGDVPLVTTTDYRVNNVMPRTNKDLVYKQMEADLLDSKELLNEKYVNQDVVTTSTSSERTRPIKFAAAALLARVYLYMGRYSDAEIQATLVINNSSLYSLEPLNSSFLKNSKETIWSLQPVTAGYNSTYGRFYILLGAPTDDFGINPVYLNPDLVNSFELNDPRRMNWINSITISGNTYYYPFKYKKDGTYQSNINTDTKTSNMVEYNMVLRLAEQYLIRAEAKARQNKLTGGAGAIADINAIRGRARGSSPSTVLVNLPETLGQTEVLNAISVERRHELFTEWGDRWYDLRRTGKLDQVMTVATPQKGGASWKSYQQYYPIPTTILKNNISLTQNEGY